MNQGGINACWKLVFSLLQPSMSQVTSLAHWKVALSRLASTRDASLKSLFDRSASLKSALFKVACLNEQFLAVALNISAANKTACEKLLYVIFACLKLADFNWQLSKVHCDKCACSKLISTIWHYVKSHALRLACDRFKYDKGTPLNFI